MNNPISLMLMGCIVLVLVGGFTNRLYLKKGMGVQFTKCMVAMLNPLIAALLRLHEALPDAAIAAILAGPFGYILGMRSDRSSDG